MKFLIKIRYANIINIINNREIIPELLQGECNAKEIFNSVVYFLNNPELIRCQLDIVSKTLENIKSKTCIKISVIISHLALLNIITL